MYFQDLRSFKFDFWDEDEIFCSFKCSKPGYGKRQASCSMRTTRLHRMHRLRTSGATPPLLHMPSWRAQLHQSQTLGKTSSKRTRNDSHNGNTQQQKHNPHLSKTDHSSVLVTSAGTWRPSLVSSEIHWPTQPQQRAPLILSGSKRRERTTYWTPGTIPNKKITEPIPNYESPLSQRNSKLT